MYVLKIVVQLPDGKTARLPAMRYTDQGYQLARFNTRQEARNWGEFILPGDAEVHEDK